MDEPKPKKSDRTRNSIGCSLIILGPLLAGLLTIVVLTLNNALGRPWLFQLIGDVVATTGAAVAVLAAGLGGFLFPGPIPQRIICAVVCALIGYMGYGVVLGFDMGLSLDLEGQSFDATHFPCSESLRRACPNHSDAISPFWSLGDRQIRTLPSPPSLKTRVFSAISPNFGESISSDRRLPLRYESFSVQPGCSAASLSMAGIPSIRESGVSGAALLGEAVQPLGLSRFAMIFGWFSPGWWCRSVKTRPAGGSRGCLPRWRKGRLRS